MYAKAPARASRGSLSLSSCLPLAPSTRRPASAQLMLVSEAAGDRDGSHRTTRRSSREMGLYDDPELARYVDRLGQQLAALRAAASALDVPRRRRPAGQRLRPARRLHLRHARHPRALQQRGRARGRAGPRDRPRHRAPLGEPDVASRSSRRSGCRPATVFGPERCAQLGDLAGQGLGLLFLKFGRDDERQADDLGLRYMTKARLRPAPDGRGLRNARARRRRLRADGGMPQTGSRRIPPREPCRARSSRDCRARRPTPTAPRAIARATSRSSRAWSSATTRVTASSATSCSCTRARASRSPSRRVGPPRTRRPRSSRSAARRTPAIGLTLAEASSPSSALAEFSGGEPRVARAARDQVDPRAAGGGPGFRATVDQGVVLGSVAFVQHGGRVYRLVGYSGETGWASRGAAINAAIQSFDELSDASAKDVEPGHAPHRASDAGDEPGAVRARVQVVRAGGDPGAVNQIDEGESFFAGVPYKVVRGGP